MSHKNEFWVLTFTWFFGTHLSCQICNELTFSNFADDSAVLSSNEDPHTASRQLDPYMRCVKSWSKNWRIQVNELKCRHIEAKRLHIRIRVNELKSCHIEVKRLHHINLKASIGYKTTNLT